MRRQFAVFTAITGYLTTALIGMGLSAAVAGAASSLLIGAALLGVSMLLAPRPPVMSTPQAQAVINQSIGPRVRGYGRALLGGTRAFFDSRDGYLYQAIMMHSGEIDAIESIRVGDRTIELNGDGDVVTEGFSYNIVISEGSWFSSEVTESRFAVRIKTHLGSAGQGTEGMLTDAFPGIWTSEHRLRGIAYMAVRFRSPTQEDFQKIFPEGYNTPVRGLCRLSRVYDPRSNSTAWSDNSALCILDYLTHPDGYRKTLGDIDLDSFIAFANLCDEDVPLKGGGTEKRYRLWGVYQLTDEPEDILRKMRATCDGELYQNSEGKIAIRGGKWEAPNVTITDRDILGHSVEQGNDSFASFNELKITYTSPLHDYQSVEATQWVDVTDQDERGPLPAALDLDFVPSPSQARRLAKIHISKSNPRWKGRVRTNLVGLDALGERTMQVVLPELQINEAFYIAGFSIDPELKHVEIEKLTISEDAYSWNAEAEEGDNPAIPEDTSPDLSFPVPQDLELVAIDADTIGATVTPTAQDDLTLQVQIRAGAGSVWNFMQTQAGDASAIYDAVPAAYEARARWIGPFGVTGEWSFPYATIDTSVETPAPVDVTAELQVDDETVAVSWRMPNSSTNLLAKVWRVAGGGDFDDAVSISTGYGAPNANYSTNDTPGSGAWDYYLTAETNGIVSDPTGPASVTVPV